MKRLLGLCLILISLAAGAQQYVTTTGKTHFFSSTPLEDIEATTIKTVCAFNTDSRKVSANIAIKSFDFKDDLMEAHFNENYLESDKYPNAKLSGEVVGDIDFKKDGVYDVSVKGKLDLHGVVQDRDIPCKLTVKDGMPTNVTAVFDITLADHKIKIPKALFTNIAEVIKVDLSYDLVTYTK
ncbi:MAG: YceI family protein [Bacteroidetes bacterium]|nr:YceI family protein [Bacteroidota bacterium]